MGIGHAPSRSHSDRQLKRVLGLVVSQLATSARPVSADLKAVKIRTITIALGRFFMSESAAFDTRLREQFEAYWSAFAQQIRIARNDAGHPSAIEPVTADSVHASLLVFPELVRLVHGLMQWASSNLK
jgi:hypothetical protein